MRTVRAKLIAVVLVCLVPAITAAVLRAQEAQSDLIDQVHRRVKYAQRGVLSELSDDTAVSRLALTLATHDGRLWRALHGGDLAGIQKVVAELKAIDTDTVIVVADAAGQPLAVSDPSRAPSSLLAAASPPLAALWSGEEVVAFLPLKLSGKPGYSLVVAEPVKSKAGVLGALALITPMDPDYLQHIADKLGTDLALKVNDTLVAASPGHPSPNLEAHHGGGRTVRKGDRWFALSTFAPAPLQADGQLVEVTASRDVTELRAEAWRDLRTTLLELGAALVLALAFALWVSQRISNAVKKIGDAAASVRGGAYVEVEDVRTRDELGRLALDFNQMVQGLRERDRLKETFGKYVTRQVADRILDGNVRLGGETLPVTVLFSDIRSFTSISEKMEPKALLDFLNVYFSGMVESVMKHEGVVDKFIGDAIMAVFGAPEPRPSDPINAVKAALEMRERLLRVNEGFRARGLPEIRSGIGLHTGQVVAGNMGHIDRMEYTVIGDTVNLASRLESLTKELHVDVILSETTYEAVRDEVEAEPLQELQVKGREQPVRVYRLVGLRAPQQKPASDRVA